MKTMSETNYLQFWYIRQLRKGVRTINNKIFLPIKKSDTAQPGVVIVPSDGSYIRFISNSRY